MWKKMLLKLKIFFSLVIQTQKNTVRTLPITACPKTVVDYDSKPLKKAGKILWHLYTQRLLANNDESINANVKTDEGEREQLWSSAWKTDSYHRGGRSLGAGGERPNCGLKRGWHMRKSGRSKKHISWLKMQLKDQKGHLKSVLYLKQSSYIYS